jgi:hypothetical protein
MYQAVKNRQQKDYNEFSKSAMFFAFSDEQFNEGMKNFGLDPDKDLDKIYRLVAGGFLLKSKAEEFEGLNKKFKDEINELIQADKDGTKFIYSMFLYELNNHEFGYTHDNKDALRALGITKKDLEKNPALMTGLRMAENKILENC